MSDKWLLPQSGGNDRDVNQINERRNDSSPDDLIDEMADQWDEMNEEDYDPCKMDAVLNALDKKIPLSINTEASLTAFREKHARLFEQLEPVEFPSDMKPKPSRRRYLRVMRLVAAALAVVFGCMITAQALGLDVFGTIARWTDEIFYFSSPEQTGNGPISLSPTAGLDFTSLQEALNSYGITELTAPSWYPPEYQLLEIKVVPTPRSIKFMAAYEDGERFLSMTIEQYASIENAGSVIFEKDDQDMVLYEKNGIKHYVMSNIARITAVWINKDIMCSLSGDISAEEAIKIIDSIYEG